jgi:hypothetical protein
MRETLPGLFHRTAFHERRRARVSSYSDDSLNARRRWRQARAAAGASRSGAISSIGRGAEK